MSTNRVYAPMGMAMPPRKRRKVNIFRPYCGRPVNVLIVNRRVVPILRHWGDDKSRAHLEPAAACVYCAKGQEPIYTSYLGVWSNDEGKYGLVEVTRRALEACKKLRPETGYDLRGHVLTLTRCGASPRAPIAGQLSDRRSSNLLTPDGFDVVEALETIFECPPGTYRLVDDCEYPPLPPDEVIDDPEVAGL